MCIPSIMDAQNTMSVLNRLHQVNKGETLFSIAKQYNVTEQDILTANPDIKNKSKLKKGAFLTIPVAASQTEPAVTEVKKEPLKNIRIGVILPFEEKDERAKKMVEFYQGFLMAADSIRKEGLSMDIYAFNSGKTEADLMNILMNSEVATLNILFGPVDEQQLPAAVGFCKQNNIKLVLPFTNVQSLIDNPNLYIASPSYAIGTMEAASLVTRAFAGKNIVVLKSNNENVKGSLFTKTLSDMMAQQGISIRGINIDADDFTYESAMNQFKDNVIVPDNTSIKTLNLLISKLDSFRQKHTNYNLSLLGYPEWQTYTNTLLNSFFTFDTYIYSSYYYNALAPNTKAFEQAFTNHFNKSMAVNYPRYAMMGFDLAYYFVHDVWTDGSTMFTEHIPYQSTYRFVQEGDNSGFCNRFVQLIHYKKTKQIELIR